MNAYTYRTFYVEQSVCRQKRDPVSIGAFRRRKRGISQDIYISEQRFYPRQIHHQYRRYRPNRRSREKSSTQTNISILWMIIFAIWLNKEYTRDMPILYLSKVEPITANLLVRKKGYYFPHSPGIFVPSAQVQLFSGRSMPSWS